MPSTDELEAESVRLQVECDLARDAFERAKRKDIESWSQDELLKAAEECGEEEGDLHCWRCYAWMLWVDRQEEIDREACVHEGTNRVIVAAEGKHHVVCDYCKKVLGEWNDV